MSKLDVMKSKSLTALVEELNKLNIGKTDLVNILQQEIKIPNSDTSITYEYIALFYIKNERQSKS